MAKIWRLSYTNALPIYRRKATLPIFSTTHQRIPLPSPPAKPQQVCNVADLSSAAGPRFTSPPYRRLYALLPDCHRVSDLWMALVSASRAGPWRSKPQDQATAISVASTRLLSQGTEWAISSVACCKTTTSCCTLLACFSTKTQMKTKVVAGAVVVRRGGGRTVGNDSSNPRGRGGAFLMVHWWCIGVWIVFKSWLFDCLVYGAPYFIRCTTALALNSKENSTKQVQDQQGSMVVNIGNKSANKSKTKCARQEC